MKKDCSIYYIGSILLIGSIVLQSEPFYASAESVSLTIHLRGVFETKISLLALSGNSTFKPILEKNGIKNGETTSLEVEKQYLPGEFVLRFDYKENQVSTPYPSEKRLLIGSQDLELWAQPKFINHPDSTRFQTGERENSSFLLFMKENSLKKEQIGYLQQFLMNYDDTKSKFYLQGIREFENRRQSFNQWLTNCIKKDKGLFAGSLYCFQYIPPVLWEGTEKERIISMISHYFDGMDFSNPVITRTSQMNEWMNSYVNLHGKLAITIALRDSLIPDAAGKAIEKARSGHPEVYGWMVDYFYRGFESNNIPAGMKVMEPYLNDPNCLTSKKKEIERRIKGIETLIAGSRAPDIELKDPDGILFSLYTYNPPSKYVLIFFWSADCPHCKEMMETVYPWQQQPEISEQLSVAAISLDETETEIQAWKREKEKYKNWKHLLAPEGVRSKVAADYFILSTPQMMLLDAGTKEVIELPGTLPELKAEIQK